MEGGRGKANSLSFVYSTLLQNVGASSLQRYIKNKNKTKITDLKNNEKKKVVMQTLARNENKSTCLCDLNSCFRWGTNFTRNFSATNVERFHVSMFSDTIHKDNGRRIVDKKGWRAKPSSVNSSLWKLIQCSVLSSLLIWLGVTSLLDPNIFIHWLPFMTVFLHQSLQHGWWFL